MSDALVSARKIRFLTVVDEFSTEALAIEVGFSLPAMKVTAVLDSIAETRGYPKRFHTDNGPEFLSAHFQCWCEKHNIRHSTIEPGKPNQKNKKNRIR
jgi:putative transposase